MIFGLLLAAIPLLITIFVGWLLLKRYKARAVEQKQRREETLEKHGDSSDIYYYYCQALQESRMQHNESLLVTGEIPRATKQQKTSAAPSFGHSSCSSSTSHDTCSVFTECVQASDTRQEDELVIGLHPGIQRVQMEERIPPGPPGELTIGMKPAAFKSGAVVVETNLSKSRFRSFEQLTGYYNNNNNNAMP